MHVFVLRQLLISWIFLRRWESHLRQLTKFFRCKVSVVGLLVQLKLICLCHTRWELLVKGIWFRRTNQSCFWFHDLLKGQKACSGLFLDVFVLGGIYRCSFGSLRYDYCIVVVELYICLFYWRVHRCLLRLKYLFLLRLNFKYHIHSVLFFQLVKE